MVRRVALGLLVDGEEDLLGLREEGAARLARGGRRAAQLDLPEREGRGHDRFVAEELGLERLQERVVAEALPEPRAEDRGAVGLGRGLDPSLEVVVDAARLGVGDERRLPLARGGLQVALRLLERGQALGQQIAQDGVAAGEVAVLGAAHGEELLRSRRHPPGRAQGAERRDRGLHVAPAALDLGERRRELLVARGAGERRRDLLLVARLEERDVRGVGLVRGGDPRAGAARRLGQGGALLGLRGPCGDVGLRLDPERGARVEALDDRGGGGDRREVDGRRDVEGERTERARLADHLRERAPEPPSAGVDVGVRPGLRHLRGHVEDGERGVDLAGVGGADLVRPRDEAPAEGARHRGARLARHGSVGIHHLRDLVDGLRRTGLGHRGRRDADDGLGRALGLPALAVLAHHGGVAIERALPVAPRLCSLGALERDGRLVGGRVEVARDAAQRDGDRGDRADEDLARARERAQRLLGDELVRALSDLPHAVGGEREDGDEDEADAERRDIPAVGPGIALTVETHPAPVDAEERRRTGDWLRRPDNPARGVADRRLGRRPRDRLGDARRLIGAAVPEKPAGVLEARPGPRITVGGQSSPLCSSPTEIAAARARSFAAPSSSPLAWRSAAAAPRSPRRAPSSARAVRRPRRPPVRRRAGLGSRPRPPCALCPHAPRGAPNRCALDSGSSATSSMAEVTCLIPVASESTGSISPPVKKDRLNGRNGGGQALGAPRAAATPALRRGRCPGSGVTRNCHRRRLRCGRCFRRGPHRRRGARLPERGRRSATRPALGGRRTPLARPRARGARGAGRAAGGDCSRPQGRPTRHMVGRIVCARCARTGFPAGHHRAMLRERHAPRDRSPSQRPRRRRLGGGRRRRVRRAEWAPGRSGLRIGGRGGLRDERRDPGRRRRDDRRRGRGWQPADASGSSGPISTRSSSRAWRRVSYTLDHYEEFCDAAHPEGIASHDVLDLETGLLASSSVMTLLLRAQDDPRTRRPDAFPAGTSVVPAVLTLPPPVRPSHPPS